MNSPTRALPTSSRRRALAVGLALLVVVAATGLLLWPRGADGQAQAAAPTPSGPPPSGATSSSEVEPSSATSAAARRELLAKEPVASHPAQAPKVEHERAHPAWDLVAELERFAQDAGTFHARALPLVERLDAACRTQPLWLGAVARAEGEPRAAALADSSSAQDGSDSSGSLEDATPGGPAQPATTPGQARIVEELFTRVVLAGERAALVRGAVLLALAEQLDERRFWSVFDDWFAVGARTHDELLRCAAFAASRRGALTPCRQALSLAQLAGLPTSGASALPSYFALRLDRVVPTAAGVTLRRWLDSDDPRRVGFGARAGADSTAATRSAAAVEQSASLEHFVTVELVYCVWALQCVTDLEVERSLLRTARMESGGGEPLERMCVRASNFVLHSLAGCNSRLLEAASAARTSQDPILSALAQMMQDAAVGGLSLDMLERIERLRYSREGADTVELMLLLIDLGEPLGAVPLDALAQRAQFTDYLTSIAADRNVDSTVAAGALSALQKGGTWPELRDATAVVLRTDLDVLSYVLAAGAIRERVALQPALRSEVVAHLRALEAQGLTAAAASAVSELLAELAQ